jgi:hypothetical protein
MLSPDGERYVDQPHVRTVDEDYKISRSLDDDEVRDLKQA